MERSDKMIQLFHKYNIKWEVFHRTVGSPISFSMISIDLTFFMVMTTSR